MRLNKDVDRRGAGYADIPVVFNIPEKSQILLYRIPEAEIRRTRKFLQMITIFLQNFQALFRKIN